MNEKDMEGFARNVFFNYGKNMMKVVFPNVPAQRLFYSQYEEWAIEYLVQAEQGKSELEAEWRLEFLRRIQRTFPDCLYGLLHDGKRWVIEPSVTVNTISNN